MFVFLNHLKLFLFFMLFILEASDKNYDYL